MTGSAFYSQRGKAGIGRRMVALTIDSLIIALVVIPIGFGIQFALDGVLFDGIDWLSAGSVATLLYLGYFIVLEAVWGTTIGKRLLGLRVQRMQGGPCSWRDSLIRNGLRIIDGFPFFFVPGIPPLYLAGGVFMMYSPQRQRLGDWAAETVVVVAKEAQPAPPPARSHPTTPPRQQRSTGRRRRK